MSGKLRSVQRVFFFSFLYVCKTMFFFFFCFLNEQEACDWGRICTVLLTNLCQTPPMNHVRQEEKRRSQGHFLIVVEVSLMTSS